MLLMACQCVFVCLSIHHTLHSLLAIRVTALRLGQLYLRILSGSPDFFYKVLKIISGVRPVLKEQPLMDKHWLGLQCFKNKISSSHL